MKTLVCLEVVLVAGISPRRPGFDSGPTRVKFVVEKIEFGQDVLRVHRVFPVSIILPTSLLITILMLLISEGQTGVAWKPANKTTLFQMSGSTGRTGRTDQCCHSQFPSERGCNRSVRSRFCATFLGSRVNAELVPKSTLHCALLMRSSNSNLKISS
jgi:hypothetical protein